jgi:hypothetical protein
LNCSTIKNDWCEKAELSARRNGPEIAGGALRTPSGFVREKNWGS